ncbi:MAG: hypothetical protein A2W85_16980 [Bacteroidetes bacterium GWF2_41_31]|nr:MAG: hypothetical protein A2W85_16980 [Bacteroidetes bacterium GWF2_41_31]OFZ08485.1 MAG: hypothetical protein A2338_08900 [Bacteroidetes bacterium RIFOXYB12_FULL_41_6]
MSPRIKVLRKVLSPPVIKGFKPYGLQAGQQHSEVVNLLYEEYEALRLSDYDKLNHHQASIMMGVSRPTFTRIYASALQKVAKAMVEGRQISIEGGKVYFDSDWYQCSDCHCYFNNPQKDIVVENCPLCGHDQIHQFDFVNESEDDHPTNCEDYCVCPGCGFEKKHRFGDPCNQQTCPECNHLMIRKRSTDPKKQKNEKP